MQFLLWITRWRKVFTVSEILLIGTPNSGKSLLFNKLTGLSQKVANFPGVTVEVLSGIANFNNDLKIIDYPGIYSMTPISTDEKVAVENFRKALGDENLDLVVCVMDATRFERGLHFALQVVQECQAKKKPVVLLANMMDVISKHKVPLDCKGLSEALNIPVFPLSAKTGVGISDFQNEIKKKVVDLDFSKQCIDDIQNMDKATLRKYSHDLSKKYSERDDILIKSQMKLDSFFLNTWTGGITFFAIMYILFQSIFTWAVPAMEAIEGGVEWLSLITLANIPSGVAHDFIKDAIFGGIGAFVVFAPQIFVLTLIMGLLEDSGYLARAAVICHRPLTLFGLDGKSFIPMLSGVACAIPGVYAARTIASPKRRWLTYFAIPLMPCSARLPVYALLILTFIPNKTYAGLIGYQGLAFLGLYLFGIMSGLLVTAIFSRTKLAPQSDLPFVLEMTPFRMPSIMPIIRSSLNQAKSFVTKAGPIIFIVTVAIWALGYFPNYGEDLSSSYLSHIGRAIEPIFLPLGLEWKYGVAILVSFLAREVFVGTLGTLFGIEGADEQVTGLVESIQASDLTLASGVALLVFFAIAMQCVSTLAVLKKESGSWKLPVKIFVTYSILAYLGALLTYNLISVM